VYKKKIKIVLLFIFLAGLIYGWYEYRVFTAVPTTRLSAGSYYPEMPPDSQHHYLQLPIDHNDPSQGTFTDFYILSPNFTPGDPVVFWLFDLQQEPVGLIRNPADFEYFEKNLSGLSYVLIGNRGTSPTLFPEIYNNDGTVNHNLAMKLYSSDQQIADIESVRQDMQSQGLLPPDGKIMLYGGSGGGFLVQQFLNKYGSNVTRALIESSGAPDLAQQHNTTFATNFYESNPEAATALFTLYPEGPPPSLAYTLFKLGLQGDEDAQTRIVEGQTSNTAFRDKYFYFKNWIKLPNNFPLVKFIIGVPSEVEVRVRIYELLGADLENYHSTSPREVVLMYEWTRVVLADFLQANEEGLIATPHFDIKRSSYTGEVLLWSGTGDQDFSSQMGQWISESYPHAQQAVFSDAHERQKYPKYYRDFRKAFFINGLYSPETQKFFDDARQLKEK
jgi:pimeloyl-ACP methyl ester carboxylesterase